MASIVRSSIKDFRMSRNQQSDNSDCGSRPYYVRFSFDFIFYLMVVIRKAANATQCAAIMHAD